MVRQTSIDCYNQIKAEGLLSKRRFQAYFAIYLIAPCTASELQHSMVYEDGGRDCMKRVSELRELGVIKEVGTRECKITKRNVIEWDLTNNLPLDKLPKLEPQPPKQLKASIDYIINIMHKDGIMFYTQEELKALLTH